ncbi:MAG TPA: mechanosensitive ion channel family protein [Dermatophilaceae bacterium]|nr:mechanosensitive ion channel family protein [Dermatophilaceae bacterium]
MTPQPVLPLDLRAATVQSSTLTWNWPDTPALLLATILIALLARLLVHRAIDKVVAASVKRADAHGPGLGARAGKVLAQATGLSTERQTQRTATIGSLLRSMTSFVIGTIAALMVMSLVGLPLAPLLASAGVGGLALGFGAQSLVRDFLSGIFMIVEDQYGVGDVIDTGEVAGTVEEVTLRITRIRDGQGVVWYVRNGAIARVANSSQGWSTATADLPVSYQEDPERVCAVLRDTVAGMSKAEPWSLLLLEEPTVVGVETISGGVMTVRVVAKCAANENLVVRREILERGKRALDAAGIRGAVPPGTPNGPAPPTPPGGAA